MQQSIWQAALAGLLISVNPLAEAQYLKVSNTGVALPDSAVLGTSANGWACTYDSERKLIWEVKTTDKGLHDKNWKYSWFDSSRPAGEQQGSNGASSGPGNCHNGVRCDTENFVQEVNLQGLCGAKDWRLPVLDELKSLVRCDGRPLSDSAFGCEGAYPKPTIDTTYFPNTPPTDASTPNQYYSSTPFDEQPGNFAAWTTNFDLGGSLFVGPVNKLLVRVVRHGRPFANAASYDPKTGRLSLSAVQVGDLTYSAELQDRGGYQFQLLKAEPLANDQTLQLPTYHADGGLLTIPYLLVFNKGYQIHLQNNNGIFAVTQANPL